jgi:hypothetical protein
MASRPHDCPDAVGLSKDRSLQLGVPMLHVVGEKGREKAEEDSDGREEWAGDADAAGEERPRR